ncbi:MAG TPA: molybdate ABC transporter substrate-binding protein [Phycisphaerales bacterium]|nr:molybdate ABC transporter substrate-binding protein [Phycisphaerales bacterium]HCD31805.1 molybdate ABC transporter substrate-binding protein [Phycisphaerales bacterium]
MLTVYFALLLAVTSLSGCGKSDAASTPTPKTLTLFAASSTTDVIEQLARMYEHQTGVKVYTSFASSSTLARQIEQGAPADLYLSANNKWMDYLAEKQCIEPDARVPLVGNRLVIVAPMSVAMTTWKTIAPLKKFTDKLAMGDPNHVPAGMYGKKALTNLHVWDKIASQVVPAKDVRGALLLVETGQTPLGLVYATDAAASHKVGVVFTLPASSHPPVRYPLAVVKNATMEASAFAVYLQSDEAHSVFERAGFEVVK